MPPLIGFLVGLIVVIAGAEVLLRSGASLAARFGVPPIVIGLTVVSVGTSAPELAVGITAGLQGEGEIAIGNIAGTNIINLLLILGLSALLRPLRLRIATLRLDLPLMIGAAALLLLLALDLHLSQLDGLILVIAAAVYTVLVLRIVRAGPEEDRAELEAETGATGRGGRLAAAVDAVLLTVSIAVVVVGANWLVDGAVGIALLLGVSEAFIGLTIVAIGTSAPELFTTLIGTIRGNRDIAVGNLIGSSVYNIGAILGIATLVVPGGIPVPEPILRFDLPLMTAVAVLCAPVFLTGRQVSRWEGGAFVAGYLAYLAFLIVTRT